MSGRTNLDLEFFTGERIRDEFELPLHRGKALLRCTVFEKWEDHIVGTLKCGARRREKLKKTVGVKVAQRASLESTVTAAFGFESIAEFKSQIKSKLDRELRLEEGIEEEQEFVFEAPKCGRRTLHVYQYTLIYRLYYQDRRLWPWRKPSYTESIQEWLKPIWDDSKSVQQDPDCNCGQKPERPMDGLVRLSAQSFGMLLAYRRRGGLIELPGLGLAFPARRIRDLYDVPLTLPRKSVPAHLLFLAGDDAPEIVARLVPAEAEERRRSVNSRALLGAGIGLMVAGMLLSRKLEQSRAPSEQSPALDRAPVGMDRNRIDWPAQYEAGWHSYGGAGEHEREG
jgi:hypothetical protein